MSHSLNLRLCSVGKRADCSGGIRHGTQVVGAQMARRGPSGTGYGSEYAFTKSAVTSVLMNVAARYKWRFSNKIN